MFHWKWALNHCDDHGAILTRVEVTMRSVLRYEYGFSCLEGSMIVTNNNDALTLPAEHDLIGHGMTVKAVVDQVRNNRYCNGVDRTAKPAAAQMRVGKTVGLS
jgi:hypothetical protein